MVNKIIVNGKTAMVGGSSNDGARVDFVSIMDRINVDVGETCYVDGSGIDVGRLKLGQRTSGIFYNENNELELVTGTISSINYEFGGDFRLDVEVRTPLYFPYIQPLLQGDTNKTFYLTARKRGDTKQYTWETKEIFGEKAFYILTDPDDESIYDDETLDVSTEDAVMRALNNGDEVHVLWLHRDSADTDYKAYLGCYQCTGAYSNAAHLTRLFPLIPLSSSSSIPDGFWIFDTDSDTLSTLSAGSTLFIEESSVSGYEDGSDYPSRIKALIQTDWVNAPTRRPLKIYICEFEFLSVESAAGETMLTLKCLTSGGPQLLFDATSFVTTDALETAVSDKATMAQVNSAISTAISDKVTMTQVNTAVNNAVSDKVTTDQLNSAVSDKVTTDQLNSAVSDKVTTSQMNTAISNATSDKVTTTQMNTAISNATSDKVTTTQMNTAISNATSDKVTTTQLNNATSDKVTTTQMNTAISNATSDKVTTTQMNTAISNATSDKVTTTQMNTAIFNATSGKVTTAQMNTAISNATSDKATMDQVNAAITEAITGALNASY